MSLFSHPAPKAATSPAPVPAIADSCAACRAHLQRLLDGAAPRGVAVKIYIENFKRLNEVFGHSYCEGLLEQQRDFLVAQTPGTVYRYIGVEFILVLENAPLSKGVTLAEAILERFCTPWQVNGTECICSAQAGVVAIPGYAATLPALLECLDTAVDKASQTGENVCVIYDSALHAQFLRRKTIAQALAGALQKNEIQVRYRPTLRTEDRRFTRAEFYMRIFVPGIGLVGSAEFVPIAEDSGQICAVQYYALEQVCHCIGTLLAQGIVFESITLPISPVLLLQSDLVQRISALMERYCIPRGKLGVEITESALTTAFLNANIAMQALAEIGVEVILNEFGTGYSGVSSILELPVDTLKLERMFVWQLETNPRSAHVIEGLVQIAGRLGLRIIAEGVETPRQAAQLAQFGCGYQQGFFYSPTIEQDRLALVLDKTLDEAASLLDSEKAAAAR